MTQKRRHVVVDAETTGLGPHHQVTEIAYFDLATGEEGSYIPQHTLDGADETALRISGYAERIAGRPMDTGPRTRALHALLGGDGVKTSVVCANPSFDVRHLLGLFTRYGLSPQPFHHRPFDVEEGAYWLFPNHFAEGDKPGLKQVAALLGIDLPNHHEALADVRVTAAIFSMLHQVRRGDAPGFGAPGFTAARATARSLVQDVWAQNHGGDACDAVADVRATRQADTDAEVTEWEPIGDPGEDPERAATRVVNALREGWAGAA